SAPYESPINQNGNPQNQTSAKVVLALLWQIIRIGRCNQFIAVRADRRWRSGEEVDYRLPDGRHGRLRRRSRVSFFSAPPRLDGGPEERHRRSSSSARGGVVRSMIGPQSGRDRVPPSAADAPARRSTAP